MKKIRVLLSGFLALLVVLITPFTVLAASLPTDGLSNVADTGKPISATLVEVERKENGDFWSITYEIVPTVDGIEENEISVLSSQSAWGIVTMTANKIGVYTMDFDITVTMFNSVISSCYVKLFNGEGYTSLQAHPAGISNKAYMGCQHSYSYAGEYEAYTSSVDVYPVVGNPVHQIGVFTLKTFTIDRGMFDY